MAAKRVKGQKRVPITLPVSDARDMAGENPAQYRAPIDPLMAESIKRSMTYSEIIRRDQAFLPIACGWDVDQVRAALTSHRIGDFSLAADLCDEIFADDRVTAAMGQRLAGLFSAPVVHTPSALASQAESDAWGEAWERLDSGEGFSDAIRYGVSLGATLFQVLWDTSSMPWMPSLKSWHPRNLRWNAKQRKYYVYSKDGPIAIDPGNGTWFLYTPFGLANGFLRGVLRCIAKPWLVRHYAWRDWARFNERHGLALIKARVPAMASADEKADFEDDLLNMGEEPIAMLPRGVDGSDFDIELLEAQARAWETFQGAIQASDNAIVLSLVWQNITTEGGVAGNYASAQVAERVKHSAVTFDEKSLSNAVYWQLARPFSAFNFGDPAKASHTHWKLSNQEEAAALADIIYKLGLATQSFSIGQVDFDPALALRAMRVNIPDGWVVRRPSLTATPAPIPPVDETLP